MVKKQPTAICFDIIQGFVKKSQILGIASVVGMYLYIIFFVFFSRYNCNRYDEADAKKARDAQAVSVSCFRRQIWVLLLCYTFQTNSLPPEIDVKHTDTACKRVHTFIVLCVR